MVRKLILLGIILALSTITCAEGNITSTSGDIVLNPASGQVNVVGGKYYTEGDDIEFLSDRDTTAYVKFRGFRDLGEPSTNELQFANVGYPRLIWKGDENSTRGGEFAVWGWGDEAYKVSLWFNYDLTDNNGLGLYAVRAADRKFIPWSHKEYDLGESSRSWDDCYCDDFHTTSRGYLGTGQKAFESISKIRTGIDGEIIHETVDPELGTETDVSLNAVTFANSKAITYLMQKIENLEEENKNLRERLEELESNTISINI